MHYSINPTERKKATKAENTKQTIQQTNR